MVGFFMGILFWRVVTKFATSEMVTRISVRLSLTNFRLILIN